MEIFILGLLIALAFSLYTIYVMNEKLKEKDEIIFNTRLLLKISNNDILKLSGKSSENIPSINNPKIDLNSDIKRDATCYKCGGKIYLDYDKFISHSSSGTTCIKCPTCKDEIRLDNKAIRPIIHERWLWNQKNTYAR